MERMNEVKKFNIMDVIIILVIIAVTAVVIKVMAIKSAQEDLEKVAVVLEVTQRDKYFRDAPQVGDVIIDASTKEEIGTLLKKEVKPAVSTNTSVTDGKFTKAEMPDHYDLYLTVELKADEEDAKIGRSLYIQSHNYACTGFVVDILDEEEAKK